MTAKHDQHVDFLFKLSYCCLLSCIRREEMCVASYLGKRTLTLISKTTHQTSLVINRKTCCLMTCSDSALTSVDLADDLFWNIWRLQFCVCGVALWDVAIFFSGSLLLLHAGVWKAWRRQEIRKGQRKKVVNHKGEQCRYLLISRWHHREAIAALKSN